MGGDPATHAAKPLRRALGLDRLTAAFAAAAAPGRGSRCTLGRRVFRLAGKAGAKAGAVI
jgi:hypothetical protein